VGVPSPIPFVVLGWAPLNKRRPVARRLAHASTSRCNSRPLPRDGTTSARSEFYY
ncbi:putative NADH-ubiquinone oxidoreductase, mitochondrial, partial [Frankliniella fusca]